MGEAFLHQTGSGLRLRSISATLAAPYNVFYQGQTIDISHAVITADFGRAFIDISPSSCSVSPATATNGLTSITISFTIGGVTRNTTVPVTVIQVGAFSNTSWANIALAAYYGIPKLIWNLGDEKTVTVGSTTHTLRIIGFDHDELSREDAKYNDAGYNRGTKKAALTIQWKTAAGSATISSGETNPWKGCSMRTVTLPALLASMPDDLKNNVRTVMKMTYEMGNGAGASLKTIRDTYHIPETIFLPSYFDANYMPIDQLSDSYPAKDNIAEDQPYEYFAHTWTDISDYGGYKPGDYLSYDTEFGEFTRILRSENNVQRRNAWLMKPESAITSTMPKYNYGSVSSPYFPIFNF